MAMIISPAAARATGSCHRVAASDVPRSSAGDSVVKTLRRQSVISLCLRNGKSPLQSLNSSSNWQIVHAEYSERRSGGAGDFVAGFVLGGAIFGALGYLIAPQVNKTITSAEKGTDDAESEEEEGPPKKLPSKFFDEEEGLEKTRKNLNEKIAQLNAAIDDVSAQLRDEGAFSSSNETALELESAA